MTIQCTAGYVQNRLSRVSGTTTVSFFRYSPHVCYPRCVNNEQMDLTGIWHKNGQTVIKNHSSDSMTLVDADYVSKITVNSASKIPNCQREHEYKVVCTNRRRSLWTLATAGTNLIHTSWSWLQDSLLSAAMGLKFIIIGSATVQAVTLG